MPNIARPDSEPVRPAPWRPVRLTWLPCTEPCSQASTVRPLQTYAAALSPSVTTASVTWLPLVRPEYTASTTACAAEKGKLCPRNPVMVPNISGPESDPFRPIPFWAVIVIWPPVTEPCSDTSLARPAFRSAAALRPLTAIATVTWSPLLRPAYRACSTTPADAAEADVAGAPVLAGTVLAGLATSVLAQRKISANTTTAPSVTRGPRLVMRPPPTPRSGPVAPRADQHQSCPVRAVTAMTAGNIRVTPVVPGPRGRGPSARKLSGGAR